LLRVRDRAIEPAPFVIRGVVEARNVVVRDARAHVDQRASPAANDREDVIDRGAALCEHRFPVVRTAQVAAHLDEIEASGLDCRVLLYRRHTRSFGIGHAFSRRRHGHEAKECVRRPHEPSGMHRRMASMAAA